MYTVEQIRDPEIRNIYARRLKKRGLCFFRLLVPSLLCFLVAFFIENSVHWLPNEALTKRITPFFYQSLADTERISHAFLRILLFLSPILIQILLLAVPFLMRLGYRVQSRILFWVEALRGFKLSVLIKMQKSLQPWTSAELALPCYLAIEILLSVVILLYTYRLLIHPQMPVSGFLSITLRAILWATFLILFRIGFFLILF